jgi:hypothetical protein
MAVVNEGEGVIEWAPGVRWGKAALAGLITGTILLVIPWGSPWAGITFTSPVIMGRPVPPQVGISYFEAALMHFAVACVYALVVAALVNTFRPDRALLIGAVTGLGLYALNNLAFRLLFPSMIGLEWPVGFAHVVFGLLTSAIYRGLAKRPAPDVPPDSRD